MIYCIPKQKMLYSVLYLVHKQLLRKKNSKKKQSSPQSVLVTDVPSSVAGKLEEVYQEIKMVSWNKVHSCYIQSSSLAALSS